MIRIGIFTGNVYTEEDYQNHLIKECAIVVDPAKPKEEGISETKELAKFRKIMTCSKCNDCERSKTQLS